VSGKILVIGANGQVGNRLVSDLLAKGEKVKAASRKVTAVEGAESIAFDLADPANFDHALLGVDRMFLLVPGGTMNAVDLTAPVIKAAAARKIKVVFMSALGVDSDDNIPYRKIELALINSGTPHVILRPNWFADNFHGYWSHGVKSGTIAVPAGDGKSSFIDVRDIAACAAAALTTTAHDGKAFDLTGPEALGYGEATAILSKVTGRNIGYQAIDDATFVNGLTGAGVPADYASFLATLFYPVREGWTARVTDDVKTLTGMAPRSVEQYAKDHVKELS
jgi:uncharacterized protein YbjT (DUF2867 family)